MVHFSKSNRKAVANRSGAMETRDHFKNGASSKSQMSRRNFRFIHMFSNYCKVVAIIAIFTICVAGAVNAQTEPKGFLIKSALVIVDGKEGVDINRIPPESIASFEILKDQSAVEKYGEKGKNGVVIITTKRNQQEKVDTPLFIVDGIEFSDIKNISPESIESITVLKEESSLKVYGDKGKNGVIIITTKK